MANVIINGITYSDCRDVNIPLAAGSGMAQYTQTDDATLTGGGQMLDGITAYADGVKYTGTIQSKSAQAYTPGTSDQTIAAGQYLAGAQTVKGDANLIAANIKQGVSLFDGAIVGTLSTPTVVQDTVTRALTIS